MATRATRSQSAPLASLTRLRATLGGLILVLSAGAAWAQRTVLEVVPLHHLIVRDVIPLLQPLLADGGTLTGTANQLIIRTTPENMAQLQTALRAIDVPIKQLRVSVTQDYATVTQTAHGGVSGTLAAGDLAVSAGAYPPNPTPGEDFSAAVEIDSYRTQRREDARHQHFVVTMDGHTAELETGTQIPLPYIAAGPYGSAASGIDYHAATSGLLVTPHLAGDRVTIEVAPHLERLDPYGSGAIEAQRSITTVTGRLGEWLPLGGATVAGGGVDAETLARTRRASDNTYQLWLKVDEVP